METMNKQQQHITKTIINQTLSPVYIVRVNMVDNDCSVDNEWNGDGNDGYGTGTGRPS